MPKKAKKSSRSCRLRHTKQYVDRYFACHQRCPVWKAHRPRPVSFVYSETLFSNPSFPTVSSERKPVRVMQDSTKSRPTEWVYYDDEERLVSSPADENQTVNPEEVLRSQFGGHKFMAGAKLCALGGVVRVPSLPENGYKLLSEPKPMEAEEVETQTSTTYVNVTKVDILNQMNVLQQQFIALRAQLRPDNPPEGPPAAPTSSAQSLDQSLGACSALVQCNVSGLSTTYAPVALQSGVATTLNPPQPSEDLTAAFKSSLTEHFFSVRNDQLTPYRDPGPVTRASEYKTRQRSRQEAKSKRYNPVSPRSVEDEDEGS